MLAAQTVLAAWLVVGVPLRGAWRYRRLAALVAARPGWRRTFYRRSMLRQWLLAGLALTLLLAGGVPVRAVGLLPRVAALRAYALPFLVVVGFGALVTGALVVQARRSPGRSLAERLLAPVAVLLPRTPLERRAFVGVAVTAGITEELLYRGFLVVWLLRVAPALGFSWALVLSSLAFGVAHAYQGARGVVGTGLAGGALASVYASTGSLFAPMLLHALIDLRVLVLVPRSPVGPAAVRPAATPAARR